MVKIRLRRMGAKKAPYYRIVVADSRSPRDGRCIEEIGAYNPLTEPATITVDSEKAKTWIQNGAQPTDTVRGQTQSALPRPRAKRASSWSSTSPPRIWGRSSAGREESPKKSGPLSKPLPNATAQESRWTLSINIKEVWTAQLHSIPLFHIPSFSPFGRVF